jgi:rhomboid protease GluP
VAEEPWDEFEVAQNETFQQDLIRATPTAFVTPVLVGLNVLVFVAMVASGLSIMDPTVEGLLKWGANFGPYVSQGQWWRLITATFIHIGIIHIAMNMYILWNIGQFTERLFGNIGFLVLYLLAGIGGSLTSVWWKPFTVSAGASGAVFGVYGGLLGFLLIQRHTVPGRNLSMLVKSAGTFLVYNLIYSAMSAKTDMAAHVGGFLVGFVLGCALAQPLALTSHSSRLARAGLVLVAGVALAAGVETRLPVVDDLEAEVHRLDILETRTFKDYNEALRKVKADQITTDAFYDIVHKEILPPWNAKRDQLAKLRLAPGPQQDLAARLAKYMSLRSQGWELIAKGIQSENRALVDKGSTFQAQAEAMLKSPGAPSPK